MNRPSQRTFELIQRLYDQERSWGAKLGISSPPLWAFDEIASSGEPLAIPLLLNFALNPNGEVARSAANAIAALMQNLDSNDYIQLDEACRREWSYESYANSRWYGLRPSEVPELLNLPNGNVIAGLATFHGNGFVREAALVLVESIASGAELPFLLLRLNDWVPSIRQRAFDAVNHRFEAAYCTHFFNNLKLVMRLASVGRAELAPLVSRVATLLRANECLRYLEQGINSGDRWIQRQSFRIALAEKNDKFQHFAQMAFRSADPFIRLWASRNVLKALNDCELEPGLTLLMRDGYRPVRCEALNFRAEKFGRASLPLLHDALFDCHGSVRELAKYWIQKYDSQFDFANTYRAALRAGPQKLHRGAILGLGETGNPSDAKLLLPFLHQEQIGIRKAVIRSLAALDLDGSTGELLAALATDQVGVSREAARALTTKAVMFRPELLQLLSDSTAPNVRRNAFKLLLRQPFWERGAFLLKMTVDKDVDIANWSQRELSVWITRSRNMPMGPSAAESKKIRELLPSAAKKLSARHVAEFELILRTYV